MPPKGYTTIHSPSKPQPSNQEVIDYMEYVIEPELKAIREQQATDKGDHDFAHAQILEEVRLNQFATYFIFVILLLMFASILVEVHSLRTVFGGS